MYSVFGRGAQRNADGTVTIKVEVINDRTEQSIAYATYTGASLQAVEAAIAADLRSRVAAEDDAALSEAVVGKLLGSL